MTETNPEKQAIEDYIKEMMPWAHGHQIKGINDFVEAIIKKQTGNQAELARSFGNQEAAVKRLSRLIHNQLLKPKDLAEAVLRQALSQIPSSGKVRLAIDWTIEANQHLLVISLIIGGRGTPIYWRAYDEKVLKGRMRRYEMAVINRVLTLMVKQVSKRRIFVTADRGFADVDLFDLLEKFKVRYIIRVKGSTNICFDGEWRKLSTMGFIGNQRRRTLGRWAYCESSPHTLYISLSRARDKKGKWQIWYLISNINLSAKSMAYEYQKRFGCEEGFRDAKWWLGFSQARIKDIKAWSRMFALFAISLLIIVTLGCTLLLTGTLAQSLLRQVVSRRRNRSELSLVSAMVALIHLDFTLFDCLSPFTKLNLEASL